MTMTEQNVASMLAPWYLMPEMQFRFDKKSNPTEFDCVVCGKDVGPAGTTNLAVSYVPTTALGWAHPTCIEGTAGLTINRDDAARIKASKSKRRVVKAEKRDAHDEKLRAKIEAEYQDVMTEAVETMQAQMARIAELEAENEQRRLIIDEMNDEAIARHKAA